MSSLETERPARKQRILRRREKKRERKKNAFICLLMERLGSSDPDHQSVFKILVQLKTHHIRESNFENHEESRVSMRTDSRPPLLPCLHPAHPFCAHAGREHPWSRLAGSPCTGAATRPTADAPRASPLGALPRRGRAPSSGQAVSD